MKATGSGPFRFRWLMLTFDFVTIAYFLWAPFEQRGYHHVLLDYVIGIVIAFDYLARFYIARHRVNFFFRPVNLADLIVVVTMLAPLLVSNFAFLRSCARCGPSARSPSCGGLKF
jgi:voltage-gated potassium channel